MKTALREVFSRSSTRAKARRSEDDSSSMWSEINWSPSRRKRQQAAAGASVQAPVQAPPAPAQAKKKGKAKAEPEPPSPALAEPTPVITETAPTAPTSPDSPAPKSASGQEAASAAAPDSPAPPAAAASEEAETPGAEKPADSSAVSFAADEPAVPVAPADEDTAPAAQGAAADAFAFEEDPAARETSAADAYSPIEASTAEEAFFTPQVAEDGPEPPPRSSSRGVSGGVVVADSTCHSPEIHEGTPEGSPVHEHAASGGEGVESEAAADVGLSFLPTVQTVSPTEQSAPTDPEAPQDGPHELGSSATAAFMTPSADHLPAAAAVTGPEPESEPEQQTTARASVSDDHHHHFHHDHDRDRDLGPHQQHQQQQQQADQQPQFHIQPFPTSRLFEHEIRRLAERNRAMTPEVKSFLAEMAPEHQDYWITQRRERLRLTAEERHKYIVHQALAVNPLLTTNEVNEFCMHQQGVIIELLQSERFPVVSTAFFDWKLDKDLWDNLICKITGEPCMWADDPPPIDRAPYLDAYRSLDVAALQSSTAFQAYTQSVNGLSPRSSEPNMHEGSHDGVQTNGLGGFDSAASAKGMPGLMKAATYANGVWDIETPEHAYGSFCR